MLRREPVDTYQDIEELSRIDGVILDRAWDPADPLYVPLMLK